MEIFNIELFYEAYLKSLKGYDAKDDPSSDERKAVFMNGFLCALSAFKPLLLMGPTIGSAKLLELAEEAFKKSRFLDKLSKKDKDFVFLLIAGELPKKKEDINKIMNDVKMPDNPRSN